jgi:predicted CXXCH cytochrome family protein
VNNVRFQPYRLTNSKCYDPSDARIRCTACHDPHGPLETNVASYDRKCTGCHSAGAQAKICPVAKAGCVNCHMPKVELPGAHARITDHQIRVARPGDAYPN